MNRRAVWLLLAGWLPVFGVSSASQQSSTDVAAIESLATQPQLFGDRQVRLKIFKALDAPSPEVVAAAAEIVMRAPELTADPQLWRRFNAALSNSDPARRKAVLDRAATKGMFSDVRVLAVVVEGLTDENAPLRAAALEIVKAHPALQQNPAVADALARTGQPVAGIVLPAFDVFKARVQPIFETIGSDKKSCASCHEDHSVMRLPAMDAELGPEQSLQARYRAALRVVDLEAPERSLILRKPTSPKREAPLTHGGDVRFEPDSAPYQAILGWIKTGGIRR
jgi:hypothetical protein